MTTYLTIQSWMITELNLSGNDLLVYAILYGFSQDGESFFEGNIQYLADWCNATKRGIYKNLQNLLDRNLIEKVEMSHNGTKYYRYRVSEQSSLLVNHGSQVVNKVHSDNNIYNNISNNTNVLLSILPDGDTNNDFLVKPTKKKRMNLFDKCYAEITMRYVNYPELQDVLVDYLKMCLERKDEKKLKSHAQWKGLLNKLDSMTSDKVAIVKQSISKYWATFVEVKQYKYSNGKLNEPEVRSLVASTDEKKEIERWQKENAIESF